MRLYDCRELDAMRPEADAVRAWLAHPVTTWFFNRVFRLDAVEATAEARDGFRRAQAQVMDMMLDMESITLPAPAMPEADYGAGALLRERSAVIGRTQATIVR